MSSFDSNFKEEIHRQPSPYGTCVQFNNAENLQRNMFAAYGYTYTDNSCKKTCYQARVYNMCSCCDVDYPCIKKALLEVDVDEKISICNTSNQTILECVDQVEKQFWTDERGCVQSCPPACGQTIYDTVISSAAWPSLNFVDSFIWNLNKAAAARNRTYSFGENKQEFVQNNCLKLQIYYEVLNYVVIKTNPAYDWNKLLSDIGGQLGLWMGSSLLSAIELFQFVFEMLALLICKIFRNRTVASLEPSTTSN